MNWDSAIKALLLVVAIAALVFLGIHILDIVKQLVANISDTSASLTALSMLIALVSTVVGAVAGYLAGYNNGKTNKE